MKTGQGDSAAPAANGDFMRDWQSVRDDPSIQFEPLPEPSQAETPGWLAQFLDWLGALLAPVGRIISAVLDAIGLAWPVTKWVLLALLVAGVLVVLVKRARLAARKLRVAEEPHWPPDRDAALDLVVEADRLAGAGRFDEATRLLLNRSIGQIAELRPDLLQPSSTAREIARIPILSQGAREAFEAIAERVERSLFALRPLGATDWAAARSAYARFALGPRRDQE